MTKVLVFTAVYKRHDILELFKKGYDALAEYWPERFSFDLVGIVSSKEDQEKCRELGISTVFAENKPISDKHNKGLQQVLDRDWDYILQLGSDDVMTPGALEYYAYAITKGFDVIGTKDLFVIERSTKKCVKVHYSTSTSRMIGAGRMISRSTIEKLPITGELWIKGLDSGLDMVSQARLEGLGASFYMITPENKYIYDIKSDVNIWKFDTFKRYPSVEFDDIKEGLPKAVAEAI